LLITIHASLDFKNEMIDTKNYLESKGLDIILPELKRYQHIRDELGDEKRFTKIKKRLTKQNMINVEKCDCLLILNYSHRGYDNYIGGNSFLEMVLAFYLHKPIYLLNNIPQNMLYTEEINALEPIIVKSLEKFMLKIKSKQNA